MWAGPHLQLISLWDASQMHKVEDGGNKSNLRLLIRGLAAVQIKPRNLLEECYFITVINSST